MPEERLLVRFTGRVQGVGFRFNTCAVAERFDVRGYVCNETDGSVKMVAEGQRSELDRFLLAIQEQMHGFIHGTEVNESTANGEFADFSIRV